MESNKVLVVNTHPFTDTHLIDFKNDFLFVSTTGQYPHMKPRYDMGSIISQDLFYHTIKNFVSLKGLRSPMKEIKFTKTLLKYKPDIIVCNISQVKLSFICWIARTHCNKINV